MKKALFMHEKNKVVISHGLTFSMPTGSKFFFSCTKNMFFFFVHEKVLKISGATKILLKFQPWFSIFRDYLTNV